MERLLDQLDELSATALKDKSRIGALEASNRALREKIANWDATYATEELRGKVEILDVF
jgi:hypothetical protein